MSSDTVAAPARRRSLSSLPPTETLEIGSGLSLSPRFKLLLTFFRSDLAVKPIDEWQLRLSLLDFLRSSLSLPVPDDDLVLRKRTDLHKRKRDEPVASGTLFVRDLQFLSTKIHEKDSDDIKLKRFLDWRSNVINRLDGIELNLQGVKFRMTVENPVSDDYERMKKTWEDHYAVMDSRSSYRDSTRRPDTVIIQGIPSRWFAEPRVSSKPSMLVTHTILSVLGSIRNLYVGGDDDLGKKSEDEGEIVPGLHCKVWVQFENYNDFCNAMNVLCGRSMQKQGSRLKVDYEVTWDKDGFFRNVQQKTARSHVQGGGQMPAQAGYTKHEVPMYQSRVTRFDSESARSKRFRLSDISETTVGLVLCQ